MHLVWHRTELRTHDHPALAAAARSGEPVLPLVIIDPIIFDRPVTTRRVARPGSWRTSGPCASPTARLAPT